MIALGNGAPTPPTPRSAIAWRSRLGDGTSSRAVVAIYTRALAFGDALLAPERAAGDRTDEAVPRRSWSRTVTGPVAKRLRALASGIRAAVSDRASLATASDADARRTAGSARCSGAIIFAFTSIAVVNTLTMIALQRGASWGLLRLVGGTRAR